MSITQTDMAASSSSHPTVDTICDPAPSPSASIRATKRKFDDALQTLDNAVASSDSLVRPPPPKKVHTSRSLYSTLAKYGIKSKDPKPPAPAPVALPKNTPHLTAILTRAASHTRKALPFRSAPRVAAPLPAGAEYRPSSLAAFLARLATFKLATYANKPPAIDAVAAAKCGWVNEGKDRLLCGICGVSWVLAGREGMQRDAANALIEKQRVSLVQAHKEGCPWKTRQCEPSIYRIPLQSPSAMAQSLKTNAIALHSVLQGVHIKHPLTPAQTSALCATISDISPSGSESSEAARSTSNDSTTPASLTEPSETAILASLFGWALAPPAPERPRPASRPASISRASSVLTSGAATPSHSRASSVTSFRGSTPAPAPVISRPRPLIRTSTDKGGRDTSLLHCALCQRRVGLWAFAPPATAATSSDSAGPSTNGGPIQRAPTQRQFDLLQEHRQYCPYVVRSTVVPSLPVPPVPGTGVDGLARNTSASSVVGGPSDGTLEGWRAVLSVVLRYGMGRRRRMGLPRSITGQESEMEVDDGVEAMVAGVKSRGGKELLKYVKGLLG